MTASGSDRTARMLDLQAVSSGYGESLVIRDLTLDVRPGEIVALLGKNGMGKTTLLKTIMGYLPLMAGDIRIGQASVAGEPPYRIARQGVAYSPQEQALFQDLTVAENLRLVLKDEAEFGSRLAHVGAAFPFLLDRQSQRAGTLSGGEQKMLLMARALMIKPRLMLVDEITEGLQPSVIQRLSRVLRQERDGFGSSILLVEQNVKFALATADHYAVLKRGEIIDSGQVGAEGAEARIAGHLSV
jgi:ABC-type branched-subunit amino acid transport system ATPase component